MLIAQEFCLQTEKNKGWWRASTLFFAGFLNWQQDSQLGWFALTASGSSSTQGREAPWALLPQGHPHISNLTSSSLQVMLVNWLGCLKWSGLCRAGCRQSAKGQVVAPRYFYITKMDWKMSSEWSGRTICVETDEQWLTIKLQYLHLENEQRSRWLEDLILNKWRDRNLSSDD